MSITCAICHDFLFTGKEDESICSTTCGHVYHHPCLLQWLESRSASSKSCPHCRAFQNDITIIKLNLNVEETSAVRSQELTNIKEELHRVEILLADSNMKILSHMAINRQVEKRNNELADQVKRLQDSENDLKCKLKKVTGEMEDQQAVHQLKCEELRKKICELDEKNNELADVTDKYQLKCEELRDTEVELKRQVQDIEEKYAKATSVKEHYKTKLIAELGRRVHQSKDVASVDEYLLGPDLADEYLRQRNTELEGKNKELADLVERLRNSEDNLSSRLKGVTEELKDHRNRAKYAGELEEINKDLMNRVERLQNSEDYLLIELQKVTEESENHQNTFRIKCEEFRAAEVELKRQVDCLQSAESELAAKNRELHEIKEENAKTTSMKEHYRKLFVESGHRVQQWRDVANLRNQWQQNMRKLQQVRKDHVEADLADEDLSTSYDKLEEINKELTDRVERLQNSEDNLLSQLKTVTDELENHQNTFRMKCEEFRQENDMVKQENSRLRTDLANAQEKNAIMNCNDFDD